MDGRPFRLGGVAAEPPGARCREDTKLDDALSLFGQRLSEDQAVLVRDPQTAEAPGGPGDGRRRGRGRPGRLAPWRPRGSGTAWRGLREAWRRPAEALRGKHLGGHVLTVEEAKGTAAAPAARLARQRSGGFLAWGAAGGRWQEAWSSRTCSFTTSRPTRPSRRPPKSRYKVSAAARAFDQGRTVEFSTEVIFFVGHAGLLLCVLRVTHSTPKLRARRREGVGSQCEAWAFLRDTNEGSAPPDSLCSELKLCITAVRTSGTSTNVLKPAGPLIRAPTLVDAFVMAVTPWTSRNSLARHARSPVHFHSEEVQQRHMFSFHVLPSTKMVVPRFCRGLCCAFSCALPFAQACCARRAGCTRERSRGPSSASWSSRRASKGGRACMRCSPSTERSRDAPARAPSCSASTFHDSAIIVGKEKEFIQSAKDHRLGQRVPSRARLSAPVRAVPPRGQLVHCGLASQGRVPCSRARGRSTLAGWRRKGLQYLRSEHYARAAACFARSGDFRLECLAEAKARQGRRPSALAQVGFVVL